MIAHRKWATTRQTNVRLGGLFAARQYGVRSNVEPKRLRRAETGASKLGRTELRDCPRGGPPLAAADTDWRICLRVAHQRLINAEGDVGMGRKCGGRDLYIYFWTMQQGGVANA